MSCNATKRSRGKYLPVGTDDLDKADDTDKTPLLTAMETSGKKKNSNAMDRNSDSKNNAKSEEKAELEDLTIKMEDLNSGRKDETFNSRGNGDRENEIVKDNTNENLESSINDSRNDNSNDTNFEDNDEENEKIAELNKNIKNAKESEGAKPKHPVRKTCSEKVTVANKTDDKAEIDIVRKMSEPNALSPWQLLGSYFQLKQKACRRLYAQTGRSDDLALFFHNGKFYAMEAWCTHMGKFIWSFSARCVLI